jgi:hypothetical protein
VQDGPAEASHITVKLSHFPWPVTMTEIVLLVMVLFGIMRSNHFHIIPFLVFDVLVLFYHIFACIFIIFPVFPMGFIHTGGKGDFSAQNVFLLVSSVFDLAAYAFLFMCFFRCCKLIEMEQKIMHNVHNEYSKLLDFPMFSVSAGIDELPK